MTYLAKARAMSGIKQVFRDSARDAAAVAKIEAAVQSGELPRVALQAAYEAATQALGARIAEREATEAHQRLLFAIANRASGEFRSLSEQIKEEHQRAVLAVIASALEGEDAV